MFDSCEVIHPTGKAIARLGTRHQSQGHKTTFAQFIAQKLGLSAEDVPIEEGDTDTAPYDLGTYASRSTPTAGGAAALAARRVRKKTRKLRCICLEPFPVCRSLKGQGLANPRKKFFPQDFTTACGFPGRNRADSVKLTPTGSRSQKMASSQQKRATLW